MHFMQKTRKSYVHVFQQKKQKWTQRPHE